MIKTKQPILLIPKTSFSAVLYLEKIAEQRNDFIEHKGEVGMYAYLIKIMVLENGKLIEASKLSDLYAPQQETFKLSTWFQIFGNITPNQVEAQKNRLMINLIGSNPDKWFGLTSADLVEVTTEELNEIL